MNSLPARAVPASGALRLFASLRVLSLQLIKYTRSISVTLRSCFIRCRFTFTHSLGWSPSSCTVSFHSKFSFHYTVASLRQWYISLNQRLHSHQIIQYFHQFDFDLRLFPQHRYTYCYNIHEIRPIQSKLNQCN